MIKLYYIVQNSFKNLTRTSDILVSFIMTSLSSLLSFFFLSINQFFSHWQNYTTKEAFEKGGMGLFDIVSPAGMLVTFLKFSSLLIAILFIFSTISAIRRLFSQLANDQWSSLNTMSLLGEKNEIIAFEFSLQSIYTSIFSMIIGFFAADFIIKKILIYSFDFGPMKKVVGSFQISHTSYIFIVLLSCLYVGGRTFFFVKRQLISFFDNLKAML